MSSPSPIIPPDKARSIAAGIRAGVYPHVASEAFGLPREVFDQAMRLGIAKDAPTEARKFAAEIREAIAHARMKAEMQMLKEDAGFWLKHGPGKASEDNPGWSNPVKPTLEEEDNNVVTSAELLELSAEILKALEPFAEARAAVVKVLDKPRWLASGIA
jgi:hypothetical protein